MRIRLIHNGCDSLEYDTELLRRTLSAEHNFVKGDNSDVMIILGCTFTQQKESELKDIVLKSIEVNPDCKIIVSGCYLTEFETSPNVYFARKTEVTRTINSFNGSKVKPKDNFNYDQMDQVANVVAISEGCYGKCSYCSVKNVRGIHKSRLMNEIVADVKASTLNNKNIRLVGQDIAAYGRDTSSTLNELLSELITIFPNINFELGSLNPVWLSRFSKDELSIFRSSNIVGNIHIPLQSASNNVLIKMKRDYTYEQYMKVFSSLRDIGVERLSTDLLVGFPGETLKDHELNISFLNKYELSFIEIFMYEPRPNTLAATYTQLPREIRLERALELIVEYVSAYIKFHGIQTSKNEPEVLVPFNTNVIIEEEEVSA